MLYCYIIFDKKKKKKKKKKFCVYVYVRGKWISIFSFTDAKLDKTYNK